MFLLSSIKNKVSSIITFLFNEPMYKPQVIPVSKNKLRTKPRTKHKAQNITGEMTEFSNIKSLLDTLDVVFSELSYFKHKYISQKLLLSYGVYVSDNNENNHDLIAANHFESLAYGFPSIIINMSRAKEEKTKINGNYVNTYFIATKIDRPTFSKKNKDCIYYNMYIDFGADEKTKVFTDYTCTYEIEINKNTNKVNALQAPITKTHKINKRKNKVKGHSNRGLTYNQTHYEYPYIPTDETEIKKKKMSANEFELFKKEKIEMYFYINFNMTLRRELHVNINVHKDNKRCSFSVPNHKWKDFFSDRIKVKTPNGNTKPIFHCVSSHLRLVKGKNRNVKTHYRGIRSFKWEGYDINIVVPGVHARAKSELDLTFTDGKQDKKVKYVDSTDTKIVNKINKTMGVI